MNDQVENTQDQTQDDPTSDPINVISIIKPIQDGKNKEISEAITKHIQALASKYNMQNYKLVFLFDDNDEISSWHANRIYKAVNDGESKDILLLIQSKGGGIEPAYLISKACIRLTKDKFISVVPRRAKSAATLISLGAHEIHMGIMSELGPIDPQFGGFPALAMQNALTLLADLTCKHPGASEMLGKFLSEKLDLRVLGYFERVNESAVQYAERLLEGKPLPEEQTPENLANHLVNHYKDHGFVIDADEAEKLLGDRIIKQGTNEYKFANEVYESLDFIRIFLDIHGNKQMDYVGGITDGIYIRNKK